jgi:DNA-binding transcriptional MocR family regulator
MPRKRNGRGADATGRSKRGGQFVPIPYDMAASIAWLSLSGAAIKVYVELRRRYNGGNNGDLSLSLDEAARLLHLGKATVARALAELEVKGFIRMTTRGRWYGRRATTYAVTDRPVGRYPPTNAWRAWRPASENHFSVLKWTDGSADGSATEPRL